MNCASGKFSIDDIVARLEKEVNNNEEYQVQYWPIFALDSKELIGCCGLRPYSEKKYEPGFHLRPCFWGQGFIIHLMKCGYRRRRNKKNVYKYYLK